jgi:hypothetical protein
MVKKLSKFFAYSIFFVIALIAFMPKDSLYFLLEKNLAKYEVVISKEDVKEKFLTLELENLEISAKGINVATIKEADITLLMLYNELQLKDLELSSLVNSFAPSKVYSANFRYTLLNPLVVKATAVGEFGDAEASFNILDKNLSVVLKPSKVMFNRYRNSLSKFKKNQNGEYVYEKAL